MPRKSKSEATRAVNENSPQPVPDNSLGTTTPEVRPTELELVPDVGNEGEDSTETTEIQHKILSYLYTRPLATHLEISLAAEISVSTVKRNMEKLKTKKLLHMAWIPDGRHLKNKKSPYFHFLIFVETSFQKGEPPEESPEKYQEWLANRMVEIVHDKHSEELIAGRVHSLLGGDWDLVLMLYSRSPDSIHKFVVEDLRTCPHVLRTSTVWVRSTERVRHTHSEGQNEDATTNDD